MIDSVRNCHTSSIFSEPITFLTPTSRARFEEPAVDKFMKLMQAISSIMMATALKM
ncbi:hypothetical protein D3C86_2187690 [compost metagenome]